MTTLKTISFNSLVRRRGGAVLEAALVLPVLLYVTFGMVEYGYFFFVKHSMQGAAREGCRNAILSQANDASIRSQVVASLYAAGLNSSNATLDSKFTLTYLTGSTVITDPTTVSPGSPITVQVDTTWGSVGFRMMGILDIPTAKVCRGVTVMRKES